MQAKQNSGADACESTNGPIDVARNSAAWQEAGRTEWGVSLAEFLKHKGFAEGLGVLHMAIQPPLSEWDVSAAPIVGPHVDGGVVDTVGDVVGHEVLAGLQNPGIAVGHGVDAAATHPADQHHLIVSCTRTTWCRKMVHHRTNLSCLVACVADRSPVRQALVTVGRWP